MGNTEEKSNVIKVDKWDGSALKNALDDSVKHVMTEKLSFVENHSLVDGRLLICSVAVLVALFALVWDYFFPFPLSREVLIFCVLSYFLLMGVLTLYTTYREKSIFLIAHEIDPTGVDPPHTWQASSKLKRFDDQYNLTLSLTDGKTKKHREIPFVKSVASFFDDEGVLHTDIFEGEVMKLQKKIRAP